MKSDYVKETGICLMQNNYREYSTFYGKYEEYIKVEIVCKDGFDGYLFLQVNDKYIHMMEKKFKQIKSSGSLASKDFNLGNYSFAISDNGNFGILYLSDFELAKYLLMNKILLY